MKGITITWLSRKLKCAEPLPTLTLGYLLGLFLSFGFALRNTRNIPMELAPLSFREAFASYAAVELPFWIVCTLLGFSRLPRVATLPIFFRALLWGYSSLLIYLTVGKSILYFTYILGSCITLLPLCCLTKLAERNISSPKQFSRSDHFRYLCQCLYFWGLTLIILFLRSIVGAYLR